MSTDTLDYDQRCKYCDCLIVYRDTRIAQLIRMPPHFCDRRCWRAEYQERTGAQLTPSPPVSP